MEDYNIDDQIRETEDRETPLNEVSVQAGEATADPSGEQQGEEIAEPAGEPQGEETAAHADAQQGEETADPAGGQQGDETGSEKKDRKRRRGAAKIVAAFAAGFAACLAVFAVAIYAADLGRIIPKADYDFYDDLSNKFGKYYMITQMIEDDPLVEEAPEVVSDESMKKLIKGLGDPYAEYYTPEEYEEFARTFEGDYVGIGVLVSETDEGVIVRQVYDGGPAAEAGMQVDDIIVKVDGVVPEGIDDAVSRMTGEENTDVTVTVRRGDGELDLDMTRKSIVLDSVASAVTEEDPEVGYIRIMLFSADTNDEFKDAVKELQGKGCDKFIVDMRDNGGGLTNTSIDIADYLLPSCTIMTEVTKDGKEKVYSSDKSCADLDMVVLVNGNTASASEILTAAIKENDAGTVIGSKTYGKGVTQISRQFKDGSAVKLTASEYLTPDGNHVQGNGIEPDIEASDEDIMDKAIEELKD